MLLYSLLLFLPILATSGHYLNPRNPPFEYDAVSNAHCERKDYNVESIANRTQFDLAKLLPQTNQTRIVCYRQKGAKGDISIHGIAYDSFYWNFQGDKVSEQDYSYVYQAAAQGITTFRYDRLGTGFSQRPSDGYNTVQAPTEIGILISLARMLKQSTKIGGHKWNKILLIGHSYGSVQSQTLSYLAPNLVDRLILTGFSTDMVGMSYSLLSAVYTMAKIVYPQKFANIPPDWLVFGTPYSVQTNFNYPPTVTTSAADLSIKVQQPVTQGSLLTLTSVGGIAENFTGPVQVLTAREDFIFTFDNPFVNETSLAQQAATTLYPASRNATAITPGKTGHGINIHTTAKGIYNEMLNFAKANNL